ncbi:MAG: right-handed parallel beta-helix repeat-containing protein [Victivallaceae bacterium]
MKKTISVLMLLLAAIAWSAESVTMYAAPRACGDGGGLTSDNAAALSDQQFWAAVNAKLAQTPVRVELAPGAYEISFKGKRSNAVRLTGIGNETNQLVIAGAPGGGSVFGRSIADDQTRTIKNYLHLWVLSQCRNVALEELFFTGPGVCGYVMQILDSQDITIRNCEWRDMRGVYFAAAGAHGEKTRNVLWENCTFANLGIDSHAHMLYNANKAAGLTVRNCKFSDCTGDYIRFRNGNDDITVENCDFMNSGEIEPVCPFLSMPLFVDFDEPKHYEYFAKKVTIRNNRFIFAKVNPRNIVLTYLHAGYNPPGRQYLLGKADIAKLDQMSVAEGRKFLGERLGSDLDDIVITGNKIVNSPMVVVYQSQPNWGAEKKFPKEEYKTETVLNRFFGF